MTATAQAAPVMRLCKGCGIEHLLEEFAVRGRDYYRIPWCRSCQRKRMKARKYGLSLTELEAVIARAGGRCEACGEPEGMGWGGKVRELCIDHDHDTGKVRGMLCSSCNLTVGHAREDLRRLQACMDYIGRHA